jgi:hypothetical protein
LRKYWHFFLNPLLVFEKKWIITLVFEINANFFRRKLAKIAENNDHNIDPRLGEVFFCELWPIGQLFIVHLVQEQMQDGLIYDFKQVMY